jgi:hypothetical protein
MIGTLMAAVPDPVTVTVTLAPDAIDPDDGVTATWPALPGGIVIE